MADGTTDPTDGGQFTQGNDGSLYGNPDTPGTAGDYSSWTWKQIEAAIDGGSMLLSGDRSQAQNVSSPQTLWQAGDIFNNVMVVLQNVGQGLQASAKQFAGGDGSPWQGDAANAFATMMTGFSNEVLAAGNVLGGGSSGLDSVPAQLITNGNALSTAQTEIEDLDTYYAEAAVAEGAPIMGNGLVEISAKPVLVAEMTAQMQTVLTQLAHNYQVTVDSIISPNALNNPGDNSNTPDNLNIPNINLNIPNINLGNLNTPNGANLPDGTNGDNLPNLPTTGTGGPTDDLSTPPNTGTGGLGGDGALPDGLGSLPTTGAGGPGAGADGAPPAGLGGLPTTGAGGLGADGAPADGLGGLPATGAGGPGAGADGAPPAGLGGLPATGAGGPGADGALPKDLAAMPTSSAGPGALGGASPSGLPGLGADGTAPDGLAALPGTSGSGVPVGPDDLGAGLPGTLGGGPTTPGALPEDLATGAVPNLSDDSADGASPLSGLPSLTGAGSSPGLTDTAGDPLDQTAPPLGLTGAGGQPVLSTTGPGLPGLTSGDTGTGGLPSDDLSTSGPGALATSPTTTSGGEEIPPMMGGGAGANTNTTDPSDASGLLSDGTKPWTTGGNIDTATPPDELGSPGGTKTGGLGLDDNTLSASGPGALATSPTTTSPTTSGGEEIPPMMGGGAGAGANTNTTDPSDASGLLSDGTDPWTATGDGLGATVPPDELGSPGGTRTGGLGLDDFGGPSTGTPAALDLAAPGAAEPAGLPDQGVTAAGTAAGTTAAADGEMPLLPGLGGGAAAAAGGAGEPSDSSGLLGGESGPWSAEERSADEPGSHRGAAAGGPGLDWAAGPGSAPGPGPDAEDPSAWETAGAVGEGMLLALGLWSERRRPGQGEEELAVRTVSSEKDAWTGGAAGAAEPAGPDPVAATWRPDRNATAAPRRRLSLAESPEPARAEEAAADEGAGEGEPWEEPEGEPQAGDLLLQEAQMWGTVQADWGEL